MSKVNVVLFANGKNCTVKTKFKPVVCKISRHANGDFNAWNASVIAAKEWGIEGVNTFEIRTLRSMNKITKEWPALWNGPNFDEMDVLGYDSEAGFGFKSNYTDMVAKGRVKA